MLDLKKLTEAFDVKSKKLLAEGNSAKDFIAVFKKYGFKLKSMTSFGDSLDIVSNSKFDTRKLGIGGGYSGDGEARAWDGKMNPMTFKDSKELDAFLNKRIETHWLKSTKSGASLEVHQDFKYDNNNNFIGQYSINGKKKKTTDESGGDLLRDISKVMKVNANKFEDWFSKKFKFDIGRLEHMEISGEPGKPNTWSGEATELN